MNPFAALWRGVFGNDDAAATTHTKVWAGVACAAATVKFMQIPEPSFEVWMAYLGLVGGYALGRRWIAARQSVDEAKIKQTDTKEEERA